MSDTDAESLRTIFNRVMSQYRVVEDEGNLDALPKAIHDCETAIKLVNLAGVFSTNEDLEELASRNICYLALPALLGYFVERQIGVLKRVENLERSRTYYLDFLRLCACYSFYDFEKFSKLAESVNAGETAPSVSNSSMSTIAPTAAMTQRSLQNAAVDRNAKIKRFRDEQDLKKKLVDLEKQLSAFADERDADDELIRDTYTTLVRRWIFAAEGALQTISDELPFARRVSANRQNDPHDPSAKKRNASSTSPLFQSADSESASASASGSVSRNDPRMRPFILTRTKVQKEVYGLGYPSVPVMSIEEFAENNAAMQPLVRAAQEQSRNDALNRTILRPADCDGCDSHAHAHGAGSSFGGEPIRVVRSDEVRAEQANQAERETLERERALDDDDETYLRQARQWDAFKDDHRVGEGNTYRIG